MIDIKDKDYLAYMGRISRESIPAYAPLFFGSEEKNLLEVMKSGWISEGRFTREFENGISAISERRYAVAMVNGTAALITAMLSLGLKPGDEVIVPSLSHSADPNSVEALGLVPVFCDVDLETLCMSAELAERVRSKKTRAILNVCAYGNSGNLTELVEFCSRNKLVFINDCAPSLGGRFCGRPMASYGDVAMHSFFVDKTITTGEGGMLLTDDAGILKRANSFKHDGRRERGNDLIEEVGYNFRVTEFQSAVGVAQLGKFAYLCEKKLEVYMQYKAYFEDFSDERVRFFEFNIPSVVPHRNIIFVENARKMITGLESVGIGARTLFQPMSQQPIFADRPHGDLRNSDYLFGKGVCLPSGPGLSPGEIERVCLAVRDFL